MPPNFILASASPRRRQLLDQLGYRYHTQAANIDERANPGENALDYAQRMAREKAQHPLQNPAHQGLPVLGCDTVISLEGQILGKPKDAPHAAAMLRQLSGTTHQVISAVAIAHQGQSEQAHKISQVEFAPLSDDWIQSYIASGEPEGKAGGYAIQGLAAEHITNINGSYSAIMGLPLYQTAQLLARHHIPSALASTLPTGKALAQ